MIVLVVESSERSYIRTVWLLLPESSCNVRAQPLPCEDAPPSGVRQIPQVLSPRELVCSARNRRCRWSFEAFAIYPSDHRILGIVAPWQNSVPHVDFPMVVSACSRF